MAEEAADEEAAAKAEDDEAAAEEDAFPFSHLRDLARSDAPMAVCRPLVRGRRRAGRRQRSRAVAARLELRQHEAELGGQRCDRLCAL